MQAHEAKDQSPDEIAADLERERAELAVAIDGLKDRLSVDSLVDDAKGFAKSNLSPYVRLIDDTVRANPAAAVMVGVGLAWLFWGSKRASDHGANAGRLSGTKFEAMSRWEDEGGNPSIMPQPDEEWITEADRLRDRASDALSRIDDYARDRLHPAAEIARQRADVLANLARETRAAMMRGLETLDHEARERIVTAREKAYGARGVAMRKTAQFIEDRPMATGAVGMAIGAMIAAALPQTQFENRLFGEERDRLMLRARELLQEEKDRAKRAAGQLVDTVTTDVKDHARELVNETTI